MFGIQPAAASNGLRTTDHGQRNGPRTMDHRPRLGPIVVLVLGCVGATGVRAQESIKVEALKQAPPSSIAPEVQSALSAEGVRIQDDQGHPFAEIWLRKA